MGYLHIDNLYKSQRILEFRECYALEKIHGTSTHISWKEGNLTFFSGGEKHDRFLELFDQEALKQAFQNHFPHNHLVIFGEAYGGSQQGQSWRYGDKLKFVAFEVKDGDVWCDVLTAHAVVTLLGLEFVHYKKIQTLMVEIDAERDAPSEQAKRNGVDGDKPREGVVLRPLVESVDHRGNRVISKHKRDDERETQSPRPVVDPEKWKVLQDAKAIAEEWVTETRLSHVLDKIPNPPHGIEKTREVINAMIEDVEREAKGEIVESREAQAAIGKKTAELFKRHLKGILYPERADAAG